MKRFPTARRAGGIIAALAVTVALGACGQKSDVISPAGSRPFTVMLDWFPNADHAALYAAIDHGYFRAAGLDVHLQAPANPAEPLALLAAGKVDMAVSYEPELLLARDTGQQLVSVAALVQRPLTSIIALPAAHVRGVADLAGKRVGTAGINYQAAELKTVLRKAKVDPATVRETNVSADLVAAMLSGKVAATLGGFWNYEALQLQLMHKHPVVIPVDRAGVPSYNELVLVVRQDQARHDGQDLRAFLAALTRGEQDVKADPAAAVRLLVKASPALAKEQKLQQESIARTLAAAHPADHSQPFGYQDPAAWASFARWMFSEGLVHQDPTRLSQPYTNEFLPGQGA